MELVISVIIGVLIIEVYAWLPRISQWLVDQAVLRLPVEDQDRYREEWRAHLDGLPNTVVKIVHALSYLVAIGRINADIIEGRLSEIDDVLNSISVMHHQTTEGIQQLKLGRRGIVDLRDVVRNSINDALGRIPVGGNPESIVQYRKALYELGQTMLKKMNRACELGDRVSILTDAQIDRLSTNTDRIDVLLENIYEQSSELGELQKFWFSSKRADRALEILNKLVDDLEVATATVDDGGEEESYFETHHVYLNEMKNITAMLQRVNDTLHKRCR